MGLVGLVCLGETWLGLGDLQLLSRCGSTYTCHSRSVPEIHQHVAGTLSSQQTVPFVVKGGGGGGGGLDH